MLDDPDDGVELVEGDDFAAPESLFDGAELDCAEPDGALPDDAPPEDPEEDPDESADEPPVEFDELDLPDEPDFFAESAARESVR